MRKQILFTAIFLLIFFFTESINGQSSPCSRLLLNETSGNDPGKEVSGSNLNAMLPGYIQDGEKRIRAILNVSETFNEEIVKKSGGYINSRHENIITADIHLGEIDVLINDPSVRYLDICGGTAPYLNHVLVDSRAEKVNEGIELPESYTGEGVIIAVIDWGFDYKHPNFLDSAMEETRVLRAWDQNKTSGHAPDGFSYGAEYVGKHELNEAAHDTFNHILGVGSHGTSVAGIAAGNGAGTEFRGIAPDAELVFVSLTKGDAAKIDAFNYVANIAEDEGKPLVVNMSFGRNIGPHDGTDLPNQTIDELSGQGRIFAGAAGNRGHHSDGAGNGAPSFHLTHDFHGDTIGSFIGFGNPDQQQSMWGQTINMWGAENTEFSFALQVYSDSADTILTTSWYHSSDDPSLDSTYSLGEDTLRLRLEGEAVNPFNNRPAMMAKVRNTSDYHIALLVSSDSTRFHAWNSLLREDDFTNHSYPFSASREGISPENFKEGDNNYTVSEPGGVGRSVVTVGGHQTERIVNQNIIGGNIAAFSGSGPTADERIKPDITAPGMHVTTSASSKDNQLMFPIETVDHEGESYPFATYNGTSMASPVVAGVIALMLEANPDLDHRQVKKILQESARTDEHTGTLPIEGNNIWGRGKVNAHKATQQAVQQVSISNKDGYFPDIEIWPNPANSEINLKLNGFTNKKVKVSLIEPTGKILMSREVILEKNAQTASLSLDAEIPEGMYLLYVKGNEQSYYQKVAIQR